MKEDKGNVESQETETKAVEEVSVDRSPRELESRETEQREVSWENPTNLPTPNPQEGWEFRWIRTSLLGQVDNPNISKQFRSGWEAVNASDHPELHIMNDHNSEWSRQGHVEIGGCLLCKMPSEMAKARDDHFAKMSKNQMDSVDNAYFKDQDPRMPTKQVFERKTSTSFGRDS
jgi:hypothetical protein|tara:strand:- start:2184 stop:2705 length:522 start_codon:yes stop_codon:yes gene_type:complete